MQTAVHWCNGQFGRDLLGGVHKRTEKVWQFGFWQGRDSCSPCRLQPCHTLGPAPQPGDSRPTTAHYRETVSFWAAMTPLHAELSLRHTPESCSLLSASVHQLKQRRA
ncbi:hypothetical protein WMY93_024633 [Mugilogobius chulae]|uniref:Uncharacterized protein n=1 Tax=Mugilogobius chulae TaxID=88201 RepID=A0AAW0N164_9GOBI